MEADKVDSHSEAELVSPGPEPESPDPDPASPDQGPESPDPEPEFPDQELSLPSPDSREPSLGPNSLEQAGSTCQERASAPDSPVHGVAGDEDDEGLLSGSENDEFPPTSVAKEDVKNKNETKGLEETDKLEAAEGEEGAIESEEGALDSDSESQETEPKLSFAPGGTPPGSLVIDATVNAPLKLSPTKSPAKLFKGKGEDSSSQKEVEAGKLRLAMSRTSLQDDHLELDYDEEIEEADVGPNKKEDANDLEEGEMVRLVFGCNLRNVAV